MTAFQDPRNATPAVYTPNGVTIVRGEGTRLWDDQGKAYIDCAAGMGVASLGHAHPMIAEAVAEQAKTLITCPELFYNDRRATLLEKLATVTSTWAESLLPLQPGRRPLKAPLNLPA